LEKKSLPICLTFLAVPISSVFQLSVELNNHKMEEYCQQITGMIVLSVSNIKERE